MERGGAEAPLSRLLGEELDEVLLARLAQHGQVAPVDDLELGPREPRAAHERPELRGELGRAARDVERAQARGVGDQFDDARGVGRAQRLRALRRRLDVAVPAGLVAVQPDVHLERLGHAPVERGRARLLDELPEVGHAEVVERAPPRDAAAEAAARQGDSYVVAQDARAAFRRDGYVRLPGVLSEAELAPIELLYQDLVDGKHGAAAGVRLGADRADHSLPAGTPEEKWRMVNVALPTHYCAPLLGNLFERRAASIARQLLGDREGPDQGGGGHIIKSYDQLLAKRPRRPDAQFNMHQVGTNEGLRV